VSLAWLASWVEKLFCLVKPDLEVKPLMSLDRTKFFAVALAALIGLSMAYLVWQSRLAAAEANYWMSFQSGFIRELNFVNQYYREAEVAQRDYVVRGDESKLVEFREALEKVNGHLNAAQTIFPSVPGALEKPAIEDFHHVQSKLAGALERLQTPVRAIARGVAQSEIDDLYLTFNWRDGGDISAAIAQVETDEIDYLQNQLKRDSWFSRSELTKPLLVMGLFLAASLLLIPALNAAKKAYAELEERRAKTQRELEDALTQLDKLAHFDYLTDLLNSRGLERVFFAEDSRNSKNGNQLNGILINCDNFKNVIEQYGHASADITLKEISKRILQAVRPTDHVSRVGRDEFLVLLPDTQLAFALRVAERIRATISDTPIKSVSDALTVTISLGVAAIPPATSTIEDVLTLTRSALRRSKMAGKNKVSLARNGAPQYQLNGNAEELVEVLCDIRNYRTVFQQIVDLNNEETYGYEVYSRGPDGKFESPDEFFRVCVENDIITNVDLLCLKHCIMNTAPAASNLRFHINLFPSTLIDTPVETLIALFPPNRKGHKFCIELSEEKFKGDPSNWRDAITALKQAGLLVAIDNVGFDISSLERLIVLEPDIIKVDRKYVAGVHKDPGKIRLLKRLTNVGKSLGAEMVAEGIENREVLPILREFGVHYGQGFLWGKLLEALPGDVSRSHVRLERLS
jgi:diguanylate cyclase (GGDEF)-like protein